jgi:hypothetical protein
VQHRGQRDKLAGPRGCAVADDGEHGGIGWRAGSGGHEERVELVASQGADLGAQPVVVHRAECGDLGNGGIGDLVGDGIDAGLEAEQDVLGNLVHVNRVLAVAPGRSSLRRADCLSSRTAPGAWALSAWP